MQPPLENFLNRCHAQFSVENSGVLADYIPELTLADPKHFGISLATIDGHVYEVGDSRVPFTIQSVSKAFVFALALETLGHEQVEAVVGVEPSGEAFNSIRLTAQNKPFNPMVNAGAITCSGLIHEAKGDDAFEVIRTMLGRFAGRELDVDESVFASERATGDRNRAIAWLLRNSGVIKGDVDTILDIYFRQCAVLVTARDLAVMASTLANRGVNPSTGDQVISSYAVARTLSVMTTSGMYDYAGEWVYRVGMPAKSGVGGGIVAALPAQLGLGTFSPPLDGHGNSVRGLKVCEAMSSHFDLHVLNRGDDVRTCIIADYDIAGIASRRSRQAHELALLVSHQDEVRVIELVGALGFAAVDYVSRQLVASRPAVQLLILDFRRVPSITSAAGLLLSQVLQGLAERGVTAIFTGLDDASVIRQTLQGRTCDVPKLHWFSMIDEAIEWAEDQVIYRYGGFTQVRETSALGDQALLTGLTSEALAEIGDMSAVRTFAAGQQIIKAGDPAASVFFLQAGMVSVKLPSGARLASLVPGMVFGEMALFEGLRGADVWADTAVGCLELPMSAYNAFRAKRPDCAERVMRNLVTLLASRLAQANAKVDLLSAM